MFKEANILMQRKSKRKTRYYRENHSSIKIVVILFVIGMLYILKGEELKKIIPFEKLAANLQQVTSINKQETDVLAENTQSKGTYTMTCTQANIVKILAYTLLDNTDEIEEKENEIWYKKYYDRLQEEKGFNFLKIEDALKPLTYQQLGEVLDQALGEGFSLNVQVDEKYKNKAVSLNQFIKIYQSALNSTGKSIQLGNTDLVLIATPADSQELGAWRAATDIGEYNFEGLVIDPLVGKTITAIVKDKQILGIEKIVSNKSTIKKCYVADIDDTNATLQIGTIKLSYQNEVLTKEQEGTICDITIEEGKIIEYKLQSNKNIDTLLRVTDDYIELEEGGRFKYDQVMIYDFTKENTYKKLDQIASGTQVEYINKDNKIESLNIMSRDKNDQVRVLISNEKLGEYLHKEVSLISDEEYDIYYNGKQITLTKNENWNAQEFKWQEGCNKITFVPKTDSYIKILSTFRQNVNPKYKGKLEIYKEDDEKYLIVNCLSMDDYVAAVISSEMPSSYGLEAAKVQAIAARSFAKIQQNSSNYLYYGAQLDDSTNTQVYNNIHPSDITYQASKETSGKVLMHNGNIINSKFFSTSCGYTANFGEVWASGEVFPTNTPVYLVSRQQYVGDRLVNNLSSEKDAYTFFKLTDKDINAFDNHSPWFRWTTVLNSEEINDIMNTSIGRLQKLYPERIKVLSSSNKWENIVVDTVGNIKDIQVKKRGQGGNIMELIIVSEKHTVKVTTEYVIRNLLSATGDTNVVITRMDGSKVSHLTMLPSAFFSMDIAYDNNNNLKKLTIYGGGFGHGVGMSQEGVKGMIDRGYTYREILSHYYPQASIETQTDG